MDISQGEVIERALNEFEKSIVVLVNEGKSTTNKNIYSDFDIKTILEEARKEVWAKDPECKAIQEKLQTGPETIDDFILNNWDSKRKRSPNSRDFY